jgi:hypothetical protein
MDEGERSGRFWPVRTAALWVVLITASWLVTGCSHHCKTNSDCPSGDTCQSTSADINAPLACAPCIANGLECSSNSECCSGSCPPEGVDEQICKALLDGGPDLDAGADARD